MGYWNPAPTEGTAFWGKLQEDSRSQWSSCYSDGEFLVSCHLREGKRDVAYSYIGMVAKFVAEQQESALPTLSLWNICCRQSPLIRPSASKSQAWYVTFGVGVGALDTGANGHGISTSDIVDMPCRVIPTAKTRLQGWRQWKVMTWEDGAVDM